MTEFYYVSLRPAPESLPKEARDYIQFVAKEINTTLSGLQAEISAIKRRIRELDPPKSQEVNHDRRPHSG